MKYSHVARYVNETPWAILPAKLDEIVGILEFHMEGHKFTAEELRARLGDPSAPEPSKRGAVAVVPLKGVISHRMGGMTEMSGGMSTERFAGMLRQVLADDQIGAILIDVDSPGGTIAGVTELHAEIMAARGKKPIVAHVNALGASAAYWIASAADEVVSTPSGQIGAIGVITAHVDTSKMDEADGITRTVFSAGKFKAEGHGPLSDEAKAAIQARVDEAYAVMVKDIARARGVKASEVKGGFGEGRVVSASQAKDLGMIDRIATADDTLRRLVGGKMPGGLRADDAAAEALLAACDGADPVADADRARRLLL
jgi:signal peptide peptidase SppA